MNVKQDYYTRLGLSRSASAEEIRLAYYEAARRFHPDKNLVPGDTEFFLHIQEAYETLSNPRKRSSYDAGLPPEAPAEIPFEKRILFSRRSLLRIAEPQLIYALLEFYRPANAPAPAAPTLNLCLVIDCSTSMQGANLNMVKATAIQILRQMTPADLLSVVAFSDRAEVVIPAKPVIEPKKLESQIHMLQTSGGTEIFPALELGYNEVLRSASQYQVNHVILLTDGRTYGDEEKCLLLARKAPEAGIGISGLGVGSEWNDDFLDALAGCTGGSSFYVSRPQDIQKTLLDKFTRLVHAFAGQSRLDFSLPPGIGMRYAFRLQPQAGVLIAESPLMPGEVVPEERLKILLEFVVQPQPTRAESVTLLDGKFSITRRLFPGGEVAMPLRLTRPVMTDSRTEEIPPAEIVEALLRLKLYRLQEQARLEVANGEYDLAAGRLQQLATHLLAQGERSLARTALLEAEHIQRQKSFSKEGQKKIKYGTRALVALEKGEGEP